MDEEARQVTEEFRGVVEGHGMNPWIYSSLVFVIGLTVLLIARKFIWTRMRKWSARSESKWGDALLDEIGTPVVALLVVSAFGIAGQSAPAIVRTHPLMIHGVHVAMIVVFIWIIERSMSVVFRSRALPDSVTSSTRSLFLTISRAILFALGFLIILDTIGVSITPILASLGVGSVAVALALQDTLSNFFGGLYILIDKPIRLDDIVSVGDVEGTVQKIGWRSTWIKTGSNDVVVVPNNKVASSQLKNFDLPDTASVITVACSVAYGSDLVAVEKVAVAVIKEVVAAIGAADPEFEPILRYTAFADNSINFSLVLRVKRYADSGLLKHELIKAIHARFLRDKIEIPFPQRVIHWNPEQSTKG